MLSIIQEAWGWTGLEAKEIIKSNDFGNFLVRDAKGHFWRICPEELLCEVVAETQAEYGQLEQDPEFAEDWEMSNLVQLAQETLGSLDAGQSFCLKVPAVLGGEYADYNLGKITTTELVRFAGDVAEQIEDLPDGTAVEFEFVE